MSSRPAMALDEAERWNSGVASLLDRPHYTLVEEIWDQLENKLGLRGARMTPWPHFSYQVGDYDIEGLKPILHRVAATSRPFVIHTGGLGVFTGTQPIVYIPVVRTAELSEWHRLLWAAIGTACRNSSDFYWLTEWFPHITLAQHDVDRVSLSRVMDLLGGRSFSWEISIDNLVYIDASYEGQSLEMQVKLSG